MCGSVDSGAVSRPPISTHGVGRVISSYPTHPPPGLSHLAHDRRRGSDSFSSANTILGSSSFILRQTTGLHIWPDNQTQPLPSIFTRPSTVRRSFPRGSYTCDFWEQKTACSAYNASPSTRLNTIGTHVLHVFEATVTQHPWMSRRRTMAREHGQPDRNEPIATKLPSRQVHGRTCMSKLPTGHNPNTGL